MQGVKHFVQALLIAAILVAAQRTIHAANFDFRIVGLQPIFNPAISSNGYVVTWNATTGLVNHLAFADSLDVRPQDITSVFATNGATTMVATDYPPMDVTHRFYYVRGSSRTTVIMTLVLDRSGSMQSDGGSTALPLAVTNFISLFDDANDYVAMVSFSSAASVDVSMRQPFKTDIKDAALTMNFGGYTCSDQGLTNALAQNNIVTLPPYIPVLKVIVFFTDGMANTFNYVFNCGPRNIAYTGTLYNPTNGSSANAGCAIPATLSSIDPSTGTLTSNTVSTGSCDAMHIEAQNRAERIAWLARAQGNTIYCIGMGDPVGPGECGFPVLNTDFLNNVANTPDSATYDPTQPSGLSVVATNDAALTDVFQSIAQQVLSH